MYLTDCVFLFSVDLRNYIIRILDRVGVRLYSTLPAVQIGFQRFQVVGIQCRKHIRDHIDHMDFPVFLLLIRRHSLITRQDRAKIKARTLDLQRVLGERLLLNVLDIIVHARGERQDQGNADNSDGTSKRSEQGPCFLCS